MSDTGSPQSTENAVCLPGLPSGPLDGASALAERTIGALVITLLAVAVALAFWNTGVELWHGPAGSADDDLLTVLLSQALLALMIAEMISTVGRFLERGELDPVPLLVIGIVASIRRLLVITAEAANFVSSGAEVPAPMLIELAILTAATGVFAWSIRLLRPMGVEGS